MKRVIEVRLIEPAGLTFFAEDWTEGEVGWTLTTPHYRPRGQSRYQKHEADEVRVPYVNVQYASFTDG